MNEPRNSHRAITLLPLLLALSPLLGQIPMDMAHGHSAIREALVLWEAEKPGKAIDLLATVHRSDTSFERATHLRTQLLIEQDKFQEALTICDEMIPLDGTLSGTFMVLRAALLVDLERFDEALAASDSAIKTLPGLYRPRHLRLLSLIGRKDHQAALLYGMENARAFPYQRDAHLILGQMAFNEDKPSQAALAIMMAQLVRWNDPTAEELLGFYDGILDGRLKPESKGYDLTASGDDLSEEDLLLKNRIGMNKSYKVRPDLDHAMCRQSHLLFSSLLRREGADTGFYTEFYGSVAEQIMEQDLFEGFVYHCLSSSTDKAISKVAVKNQSKVTDFRKRIGELLAERNNYTTADDGTVLLHIYSSDGDLTGHGPVDKAAGKIHGEWTYYHKNGRMSARGIIGGDGERQGEWSYWHENGRLKSVSHYEHGKAEGLYKGFYWNGNIADSSEVKDDRYHGMVVNFHPSGGISTKKMAEAGDWNGPTTEYHHSGSVMFEYAQKDNKAEGLVTRSFPDGTLRYKGEYKAGEREGIHTDHHNNGQPSTQYTYLNGAADGPYQEWAINGVLTREGTMKAGRNVGERKSYDEWGDMREVLHFNDQGQRQGTMVEYNDKGGKYCEFDHNKDLLMRYRYFDRAGNVVQEGSRSKGKFQFRGTDQDGRLRVEGVYLDEGMKDGEWTYYYPDGTVDSREFHRNGKQVGEQVEYHVDGTLAYKDEHYEHDDASYFTRSTYYLSGGLSSRGQYKGDAPEGVFEHYFPNGKLEATEYFKAGERDGWQYYYDPQGILQLARRVQGDILKELIRYDELGEVQEHIKVPPGRTLIVEHHRNGAKYSEIEMVNGIEHGTCKWYYPNGTLEVEGSHVEGERDGKWVWYHINGKRSSEREYVSGRAEGMEVHWYDDGTVKKETTWKNGRKQGEERDLHMNGKVAFTRHYENGKLHGTHISHDMQGTPQLYRFYHKGRLAAYAQANGGSTLDTIPVEGGVVTIEVSYADGTPARKVSYRNGELHGEYLAYHPNGKIMDGSTYRAGLLTGTNNEYHPNGQLMRVLPYLEGRSHGEHLVYWDNGELREKRQYMFGEMHGERVHYDRSGTPVIRMRMRGDQVVEVL